MPEKPIDPRLSVTVLPGVPGMAGFTVDEGVVPFPDTTTDFVKVLQEHGVTVKFALPQEQRVYVGHKALEVWLPVLEFTRDLLTGIGAGLLVESLKAFLEPNSAAGPMSPVEQLPENTELTTAATSILHVEWHVSTPDGQCETFKADGSVTDVLDSVGKFEQHLRDDH